MGCGKRVVGALVGCGAFAPAWAQDVGARAQAHGDALRADLDDVSGLSENLAALTMKERYDVFAGAGLGPDARFVLRGGAVDSRTSPHVTIGAGYERLAENVAPTGDLLPGWKEPDEVLDNPSLDQTVYAGVAVPVLDRHLVFAGNGRYRWGTSLREGSTSAFDFGFSVAGRPAETVTLSLGARNLLNSDDASPRVVDFGARWQPGKYFAIEGDAVAPAEGDFALDRFGWHGGVDASFTDWLTVRAGYENVATASYVTAGAGLGNDKVSLDYGMRLDVGTPSRNWHALDLRVSF
jgi:hypothetical protein